MSEKKKYIPPSKKEVLAELKQIDKFDLLKVKAKAEQPTSDTILSSRFEEINAFIDENKRLPTDKGGNPIEFTLYSRLLGIQLDPKQVKALISFDRYGLLEHVAKENDETEKEVIVEITEFPKEHENKLGLADKFGLLRNAGSSIFDLKHIKSKEERTASMPDVVAKRKKCLDFDKFEPLFKKVHEELKSGDRKAVPFQREQDIKVNDFFIYKGITCYVDKIGELEIKNGRRNARLRLIFENGLENNMYLRALANELYKDGRRILPSRLAVGGIEIDDKDLTGFIYVLKSKSTNPEIKAIPNLYKIGFCSTTVEERIKNAKNDPTYLMAEVKIITSYRVAGIKPTYFENLIHKLFDHVKLKVEVTDRHGMKAIPKEWYSVPFEVIDEALTMIETKEIVGYVYDAKNLKLVKNRV